MIDEPDSTRSEDKSVVSVPVGQPSTGQPRTAKDVYLEFCGKVGQRACDVAIGNYLQIDTLVELVLENSTPELLEEYLHDSLIDGQADDLAENENPQSDRFLEGPLDFPQSQEE